MGLETFPLVLNDPVLGEIRLPGDGYAGPTELISLIGSPAIERALGMSIRQREEAERIINDYREVLQRAFEDFQSDEPAAHGEARMRKIHIAKEAVAARVRNLLTTEQQARLRQIDRRIRDADALLDEEFVAELGITPEQRERLIEVREHNLRDEGRLLDQLQRIRFKTESDQQSFINQYRGEARRRLAAILTPEQRQKWIHLQGGTAELATG